MKHILRIATAGDVELLARRLRASVEDKREIKVTVEPWERKRSVEQNALYWVTLTEISRQAPAHMGGQYWPPDVWHEYMRRRFLPMVPGPNGTGLPVSTTTLTVREMAEYITQIQAWMAQELGVAA